VDTHDIYLGTNLEDVNGSGATPVATGIDTNSWTPPSMELYTTYYWRVDTVNDACAASPWPGPVWEFETSDGLPFAVYPLDEARSIPVDANLSWSVCQADAFDVYFSTNEDAVANRLPEAYKGRQTDIIYDLPNLGYLRDYYWAIDKVVGSHSYPGHLWHFKTSAEIVDPALLVWYQLDEDSGTTVEDYSGRDRTGYLDSPEDDWDPNRGWDTKDGQFGGSRVFYDDSKIFALLGAEADTGAVTVSCWLKNAYKTGNNWAFGIGGEDREQIRAAVPLDDGMTVHWQAGNDTNDVMTWDMVKDGINPATLGGWHHWVFIKDENAGYMSIYFDGQLADSNNVVDNTLAQVWYPMFSIGALAWSRNDFVGKIDDFRLYKRALSADEVEEVFRGGSVELAWGPQPSNGATDVERDVNLVWSRGDYAVTHDVYFGTSWDDVNDADTTSGIYKGRQGPNTYNLMTNLLLDTDYYWRIDEVNDNDPNLWKGNVWKFTVANYIVLDDFESYHEDLDDLYWFYGGNWLDGIDNGTGSTLYLGVPSDPTHTGAQSLMYIYYNASGYSEAERVINTGERDWTEAGLKALTLFFYGDPGNDAGSTEQMYCGIEDAGTNYGEVQYGAGPGEDMSDLQEAEWHEWNIAISDFTGTTPGDVRRFFIGIGERASSTPGGSGTLYFDDIRLSPPKCVPIFGPDYDFSGNCIVDVADVGIMADAWLASDACLPVTAPTASPVGWWKLDGNANDSAGTAHGTAEGTFQWITGHIDTGAIEFTGDGGRVLVPNAAQLNPTTAVTAMAWVNYSQTTDYEARIVAKGADEGDRETFALQLGDSVGWFVRDANTQRHAADSDEQTRRGEWFYAAGSYDGDKVRCYVNGRLGGEDSVGSFNLLVDANGVGIGNRTDALNRALIGAIDDVRIYNVALSDENVAYIATQGSGYVPLQAEVNIYDAEAAGSKAVNFKDLAELMTAWLEQKLWPQ